MQQLQAETKKVVLVVDDAPANIQIVNAILKDTYNVRVAINGEKALELARVTPQPDLILLDVMMPGIDGYEVCARLKASEETRDTPVIFLTGQTETIDETRGFVAGAVDYIHKPFSPAVVLARVKTHLALRGMRDQLAHQLQEMQRELETARQIQLSILPASVPQLRGLEIAARYLPMNSVAGDFYDFVVVDEKRVGILVADVSGHGMPSALIASMIKIAFAAQGGNTADPAAVLSGLNQSLCGKFQYNHVTAAYIYIDLEAMTVSYAGAGHPPLMIWNRPAEPAASALPGTVREVEENGLFLGRFSFATYKSVTLPVKEGDWLLLYTDGIPETTNPAMVEFGDGVFQQVVAEDRSANPEDFADRLLRELSAWSRRSLTEDIEDDVTVVAVHLVPAGASSE